MDIQNQFQGNYYKRETLKDQQKFSTLDTTYR